MGCGGAMRIRPENVYRNALMAFLSGQLDRFSRRYLLNERFARLRHQRFRDTEARYVSSAMTCKHAMRSLRFDKFDLDHRRARLIHAGYTAARHRFQGEQRHSCGAVACGRGGNVHVCV